MIIESIKKFIEQCPHLELFNNLINVNYLDSATTAYSIEEVPTEPILKRYVNGYSKRKYDFIFASRESYGVDVFQNIENSDFYEKFADWIEEQNNINVLPNLKTKEALSIEVTTSGYAFQTEVDRARYQIQLRLIYLQKGGR